MHTGWNYQNNIQDSMSSLNFWFVWNKPRSQLSIEIYCTLLNWQLKPVKWSAVAQNRVNYYEKLYFGNSLVKHMQWG